jgi:hypothetical protein
MNPRSRTPAVLALLILVVLAGAYAIVARNNAVMGGVGQAAAGMLH